MWCVNIFTYLSWQFEQAIGALPNVQLPVANQLEQAIATIKGNVKIILDTQAENKTLKAVSSLNINLSSVCSSILLSVGLSGSLDFINLSVNYVISYTAFAREGWMINPTQNIAIWFSLIPLRKEPEWDFWSGALNMEY